MNCQHSILSSEGLLHIEGPDTLTFLQGQTTCDTRELSPANALPGVYCTPQGRVVCDFLLVETGEERVALRMRASLLEEAAAVLGKYILFSKAEIVSPEGWQLAACWGKEAAEALGADFPELPAGKNQLVRQGELLLIQVDDAGEAFELYSPAQLPALPGAAAPESQYQALAIERGEARIEAATSGEFVPQVLNYDHTGHISFTKGCYTGQEVVARLHYRGKAKRRTYIADLPPGSTGEPGTPLFLAGKAQAAGDLVNLASDAAGATRALVSCTTDALESGLLLGAGDGPQVSLTPPPYPLD